MWRAAGGSIFCSTVPSGESTSRPMCGRTIVPPLAIAE